MGPKFVVMFSALCTITGCSLGFNGSNSTPLVTTCQLPTDQDATLEGKWKALPVPIAFHGGDFTTEEAAAMTAAADTWNTFFNASQSISSVLNYGGTNVTTSSQPMPTNLCAQGLLQGGAFTGQVVIYKDTTWPHSGLNSVMALTSFCTNGTSSATTLGGMYMAVIEINYQGFFQPGLKQPDLQTIITHEFGHLLGLYHSCDTGSTTPGRPDCSEPNLPSAYSSAIMFPTFGFNADLTGVQEHSLQPDDEGRANCLYPGTGATGTPTPSGGH